MTFLNTCWSWTCNLHFQKCRTRSVKQMWVLEPNSSLLEVNVERLHPCMDSWLVCHLNIKSTQCQYMHAESKMYFICMLLLPIEDINAMRFLLVDTYFAPCFYRNGIVELFQITLSGIHFIQANKMFWEQLSELENRHHVRWFFNIHLCSEKSNMLVVYKVLLILRSL